MFFSYLPHDISTHAPIITELDYCPVCKELSVTISHEVDNPEDHYVETVEIRKNDDLVNTSHYTSQSAPDSFTYEYHIDASKGDVLKVTVYCNIQGQDTAQLEINQDGRSFLLPIAIGITVGVMIVIFIVIHVKRNQPK